MSCCRRQRRGRPQRRRHSRSRRNEYIELANVADATVDLSGVTIFEEHLPDLARHTFADGTVLKAGEAIVVFGGGDVSSLTADNASSVVADNDDAGLPYGLALRNDGDKVSIPAVDGVSVITELAAATWTPSNQRRHPGCFAHPVPDVWAPTTPTTPTPR